MQAFSARRVAALDDDASPAEMVIAQCDHILTKSVRRRGLISASQTLPAPPATLLGGCWRERWHDSQPNYSKLVGAQPEV